jgi:hypothetical protein
MLRTGVLVPESAIEPVMAKLRQLESSRNEIHAFHDLIRLCRNPNWKVISVYHEMLERHGWLQPDSNEIDPTTRAIIHAATLTKRTFLPVITWPVLEEAASQ